jgi:hypothetical protein
MLIIVYLNYSISNVRVDLTPYLIVSQSVVSVSLIEVIGYLIPFQNMVKELYPQ